MFHLSGERRREFQESNSFIMAHLFQDGIAIRVRANPLYPKYAVKNQIVHIFGRHIPFRQGPDEERKITGILIRDLSLIAYGIKEVFINTEVSSTGLVEYGIGAYQLSIRDQKDIVHNYYTIPGLLEGDFVLNPDPVTGSVHAGFEGIDSWESMDFSMDKVVIH